MPQSQSVYHPLNGREIREILKKRYDDAIDKIPMMKEGHAYHEAVLVFSFLMTATPADAPVPSPVEFELVYQTPGFNLQDDYINKKDKAVSLKTKRTQLEEGIKKIDELLSIVEAIDEVDFEISAGKIPDQVRIDNGLPLPRIVTVDTLDGPKTVEKFIDYDKI